MGDPGGIGAEITAKAMAQLKGLAQFIIIGDRGVFEKIPGAKRKEQNYQFIDLNNIRHKNFRFGRIEAEYGRASVEYLDKAMELIKNKEIDCLVTCPISKKAVNLAGFRYSGHTEYFAQRLRVKDAVMMLLNDELKFSLVTRHIPLESVSGALTKDRLYRTIYITYRALKNLFSIANPRIVVCGLNPHASDNGVIGDEENKIIKPVIKALKKKVRHIDGPLPADTAIAKAKQKVYDCVIAMYHDQALIPLKLCGNEGGVNITLGLPFIRTSPLHGTAFDIAGRKPAHANSLIAAIKLAVKCTRNQKKA